MNGELGSVTTEVAAVDRHESASERAGIDVHAYFNGKPTTASAVLHVHLKSGRGDPDDAAAELRSLANRARTIGLGRLIADFAPADRTAWEVLDASALDWQIVEGADWVCAVLRIEAALVS